MSLPSDVTPDISEAAERMALPRDARRRLTLEQKGWMAAAFVAFIGIVYGGPALGRLRRAPRHLRDRAGRRLDEVRRKAQKARKSARKRVRRLGGGALRR